MNNSSFKAFLELLPWLRELISDFYSSNYASCLQTLEKMKVRGVYSQFTRLLQRTHCRIVGWSDVQSSRS